MRELAKSLVSYGWAVSIYGVQQMVSAVTSGGSAPGKAHDPSSVVSAITDVIGLAGRTAVNAGVAISDAAFGLMTGGGVLRPQPPAADSQTSQTRRRPGTTL